MSTTKRKFIAIETSSSSEKYVSIFEVEDENKLSLLLFNEYTVEQLLHGKIEILEITDNPRLELNIQIKTK